MSHQYSNAENELTEIMRPSRQSLINSPLSGGGDHDHRHHRSHGLFSISSGGDSKEGFFRRNSIRGGSRASTPESDYGAIEDWDDLDDEDLAVNLEDDMTIADDGSIVPTGRFSIQMPMGGLNNNSKRELNPRRWSVMEKLNRRYYCRIRSCDELTKIINGKCMFSTLMLFVFVFLLYLVIKAIFFNKTFEPQTYDFIVIGAGPAGSVLTRKLVDGGARVLLLEAGNVTQYELGGIGYSGSPLTVFDIPLLWTAALKFPDHTWAFDSTVQSDGLLEKSRNNKNSKNRKKKENRNANVNSSSSTDINLEEINDEKVQAKIEAIGKRIGINPIIPKGLGGGGAMNAMVYTTALESDIRRWNIPKISWELMNSTYRDLEAFYDIQSVGSGSGSGSGSRPSSTGDIHGKAGPIGTSTSFYEDELSRQFIQSATQAGIPFNDDFNDPTKPRQGVGYYQFRIKNGVRSSAAQTMLGPLIRNKQEIHGFTLEVGAEVKRILLVNMDSSVSANNGAIRKSVNTNGYEKSPSKSPPATNHYYYYYSYGVEYEVNGVRKTALLGQSTSTFNKLKKFEGSRSIILSAGAIMTPKLLMDSGIGDPDVLQAAKITPLVNNKNVGKNLQDHPAVQLVLQPSAILQASYPTSYTLAEQWMNYFSAVETLKSFEEMGLRLEIEQEDALFEKIGVLGSPGFAVGAFLTTPYTNDSAPDIQITVYPTMELAHIVYNNRYSVKDELAKSFGSGPVIVVNIALLRANMRYNVSICTGFEGLQYPCVLEDIPLDIHDINRLAWGVEKMREVLHAMPFGTTIERELVPGALIKDSSLEDWIRLSVSPSSHWTSSCRMGIDPTDSALDTQFNVRGVRGLKVVDASAIPFVPSGNIGATVTAFASVATDIISGYS